MLLFEFTYIRRCLLVLLVLVVCTFDVSPLSGNRLGSENPQEEKPLEQSDQNKQAIEAATTFLGQLEEGDFDAATATFDETMSRVMPSKKLEATWAQVQAQAGSLQSHDQPTVSRSGVYRVVSVPCKFERASLDTIVTFDAKSQIAGLFFRPGWEAPAYVDDSKFKESPIVVGNEPWELPGTLAVPEGEGPFPAVVLIHGSGPQDRDESIGPNKPFRDLAQGLASRGIAVVRFDKRTLVHGKQIVALGNTTVYEESIEDALLSVQLLQDHPKIDKNKIFVLGHSLGGYLMPRIVEADKENRMAGVILLAGNTRSLADLLDYQIPYLLGLDGSISDDDQKKIDEQKEVANQIRDLEYLNAMADGQMLMGAPKNYFLDLHGYEPAKLAASVFSKALILQGVRDYQVTMKDDFATWRSELASTEGVTFKSYPKLNHLFIAGRGQSKPIEYQRPGHVAAEIIDDITNWIGQ